MKMKDQKGAVLGWVLIVLLVILMLLCTMLSMSAGYYKNVLGNIREQQLAYTARSVSELIAEELKSGNMEEGSVSGLMLRNIGSEITVEGMDDSMGNCTVMPELREDGNLYVTVRTEFSEKRYSLQVMFQPISGSGDGEDSEDTLIVPKRWNLALYMPGEPGLKEEE